MLNASHWSGLLGWHEDGCGAAALAYPLPGAERIAVIGTRLRLERRVRSYLHWSTPELEAWRPQALAGHRSELFTIGELRRRRFLPLADLSFPLVVLSSLREGPLSSGELDRLWSLYGLPAYEQIRDADETLLAWECDARAGWHLTAHAGEDAAFAAERLQAAGWPGKPGDDPCACGETTAMLAAPAQHNVLVMACGAH